MALTGASRTMCLGWIFCSTLVLISTSNAAVAHDSHNIQVINVEDNSTITTMPYNATPVSTAPPGGLIGQAVYIAPHDDACSDDVPSPPGDVNMTWIAVVALENCTVHEKAVMVERAGFAAAVFYNSPDEPNNSTDEPNNSADEPKQTFVQKRQEAPKVHIMVVSVGYHDGMLLAHNYSYTNRLVKVRLNSPPAVSVDATSVIWVGACFMTMAVLVLFLKCVYSCLSSSGNHKESLQQRRYKRGDHYDTCAICMEEFVDRERVRVLPCQHVYHRHCVDPWLRYHRPTCPQCKCEVDPEALGPDERSTLISQRVTEPATPTALAHRWYRAGLGSYMFPHWASVMAPVPAYYQPVNLDRDEGRDRPYQVYDFTSRRQREASGSADTATRAAMLEQGGETAGSPTPTPTLTSPAGEEAPGNGQAMPAPRQESSGTQTRLSSIRRIKHTGNNPRSDSSDEVTSPSLGSSEEVSQRLGPSTSASRRSNSSSTQSSGRPLSATRPAVWVSARSLRPSASLSALSAVSPRRSTALESSSAELAAGAQASQQRSASTQTSLTGMKRKRGGSRQPQSSYQVVSSSTSSAEQVTRQSSRPITTTTTTTTTTTSSSSPESTAVASGRTC